MRQENFINYWERCSAVLGVSPMSDCRGFPHERLHQDMVNEELII
ncbi:hypothetical protein [Moorena sp. SIO3H5]|nr:hypothetical protein [Moorena sp. SIO3H5]